MLPHDGSTYNANDESILLEGKREGVVKLKAWGKGLITLDV